MGSLCKTSCGNARKGGWSADQCRLCWLWVNRGLGTKNPKPGPKIATPTRAAPVNGMAEDRKLPCVYLGETVARPKPCPGCHIHKCGKEGLPGHCTISTKVGDLPVCKECGFYETLD